MSKYLLTLFLIVGLLPLHAFAANEFEFLQKDLDVTLEELEQYEADFLQQMQNAEYDSENDLFPSSGSEEIANTEDFVVIQAGGTTIALTDVPHEAWFARYVQDISERKIISGYSDEYGTPRGLYGPADTVTIEQLAKIAVLSSAVDQSKCPDTPKNKDAQESWSSLYISCAEHLGWSVFADGSVDPSRPALRADVVSTILQAFHREMLPATGTVFKDVSNTMPSRYAIETAATDGIVSGYTDKNGALTGFFGPFDTVNRAETAKIISLALQTYGF